MHVRFAAAFLLPLNALAAAPIQAQPIAPEGKWVVNFDEAQCIAHRDYRIGADRFTFFLKPSPLGNVMQVALMKQGSRGKPDQLAAEIQVDGRAPIQTSALVYEAEVGSDGRQIVHMMNVPAGDAAAMRQARSVRFLIKDVPDATLGLPGFANVMRAMDHCLANLQQVWNVRKSNSIPETARPTRPLRSLFSSRDYPEMALDEGQSGVSGFVLLIDEKGAVADCTVDQTSGIASLDSQTCYVMRTRGRFEPAVGPDGRPAKSALMNRVRWKER